MRPFAPFALVAALLAGLPVLSAGASERLLPEDYLSLLRIDVRAAKAGVVAEALELSPDEAERFWPIYRDYDSALGRLNVARINMLREFAANYATINETKAMELTNRTFEYMRKRLKLLEKYSRKIERATSPIVAARFAQIENQMLMLVDVQLASDLPLIPRQAVVTQLGR